MSPQRAMCPPLSAGISILESQVTDCIPHSFVLQRSRGKPTAQTPCCGYPVRSLLPADSHKGPLQARCTSLDFIHRRPGKLRRVRAVGEGFALPQTETGAQRAPLQMRGRDGLCSPVCRGGSRIAPVARSVSGETKARCRRCFWSAEALLPPCFSGALLPAQYVGHSPADPKRCQRHRTPKGWAGRVQISDSRLTTEDCGLSVVRCWLFVVCSW